MKAILAIWFLFVENGIHSRHIISKHLGNITSNTVAIFMVSRPSIG